MVGVTGEGGGVSLTRPVFNRGAARGSRERWVCRAGPRACQPL